MPKAKTKANYVNVHRSNKGYRDKYKKDVELAVKKYASTIGKKEDGSDLTPNEWKTFYKTNLIPLDKRSERQMIELFKDNRDELNSLLILHNTKASDNLAEAYYKKYEKASPTKWHDLEDFKQMALEGLAIAAQRFDYEKYDNKFITYATNWIMNRVLHTCQEKGALLPHTSMSMPVYQDNDSSEVELESVLTPEMLTTDYREGLPSQSRTPISILDQKNSEENYDFYSEFKKFNPKKMGDLDEEKARKMMKYLIEVVDNDGDTYENKQIFLYMFSRVFKKCTTYLKGSETIKLRNYIKDAADSKEELLSRLGQKDENGNIVPMNEDKYEEVCQSLIRRCYNGL